VASVAVVPALPGAARAAPPGNSAGNSKAKPKAPAGPAIHVWDYTFDPVAGPPALAGNLRATGDVGYAIVQHQADAGQAVYDALVALGVRVYGPIINDAFLVGGAPMAKLKAIKGVRVVVPFHPAFKLAPALRAAGKAAPKGELRLAVTVFKDAAAVAAAAQKIGGKTQVQRLYDGGEALVVTLPAAAVPRLAALPDVRAVEPAAMPLPQLDVSPGRIGVRATVGPPWGNIHNLTGAGQTLGIYDGGCDTGNTLTLAADFAGRLTGDVANWTNTSMAPTWAGLNYAGQPAAHGTLVTDIAMGNGGTSVNQMLTGVAFAATGVIRPFNADSNGLQPGYLNIGTALQNAYNLGARVHNNSWLPANGTYPNLTPILNTYSPQASAVIDQFTVTNPTMLVLTSSDNWGPNPSTLGSLSCSKNSLSVGNSGNGATPTGRVPPGDGGTPVYAGVAINTLATSSSRGPAPGGRLRPEVCAPGAMVAAKCPQSMIGTAQCPTTTGATYPPYLNQPGFAYASGSSMSTPLVSGSAILLRQFIFTQTNLPGVTGMLLKALLVNGAAGMYNYAPDMGQGWGQVNLTHTIDGWNAGHTMYYDSLNEHGAAFRFTQTGQSVVFQNVVFAQGAQTMITLTWYDPVDALNSGVLVNDLNLTLTAQDGTVYRGGFPSMAGGVTAPNGPADTANNTEKIVLAAAPAGNSLITVFATRITASTTQAFALAVSTVDHQGTLAATAGPVTGGGLHLLQPVTAKPASPPPAKPAPPRAK
jgi:hypothetical protein